MEILVAGLGVQFLGGAVALLLGRFPRLAGVVAAAGISAGALMGLAPTLHSLSDGADISLEFSWRLAFDGRVAVGLDPLTAVFLLPVLLLSIPCSIYGADYLSAHRKEGLGGPWFFFSLFVVGMGMVLVARTAFLFLVAWEIMSLAAFFLVAFEQEKEEVRRAGWIYLIATHLGAALLLAAFGVVGSHAGSLSFSAMGAGERIGALGGSAAFVLALAGFGAKAGFIPFHVWLPEAHSAAPSHVSAMMSAVMIKVGLYGLFRVLTFLGAPAIWWGAALGGIGILTALYGAAMALQERDIKRVLAYSSIENMGLIAVAIGAGIWGRATSQPVVAALGIAGGLIHVWNHAAMKGLMFLAAGCIAHGADTRDMERLGGLMRRMPYTGTAMVLGGAAIAALPPLNGFTGKWLMYLALMSSGLSSGADRGLIAFASVSMLALIGSLTVLAFVRVCGIALLGSARSAEAAKAHESSPWMVGPIYVLLVACALSAFAPQRVAQIQSGARAQILSSGNPAPGRSFDQPQSALAALSRLNVFALVMIGAAAGVLTWRTRLLGAARASTWGCGCLRPSERMQYTGLSFSELFAEHLLPRFLRPKIGRKSPSGIFASASELTASNPEPFTEKIYQPFFELWAKRFARARVLQQGHLHLYLMYILFAVVLALSWVSLRGWLGAGG